MACIVVEGDFRGEGDAGLCIVKLLGEAGGEADATVVIAGEVAEECDRKWPKGRGLTLG